MIEGCEGMTGGHAADQAKDRRVKAELADGMFMRDDTTKERNRF